MRAAARFFGLPPELLSVLLPALLLAGCSGPATDASGASADEARQLNEAAATLDNSSANTAPPTDNQTSNQTDQEQP